MTDTPTPTAATVKAINDLADQVKALPLLTEHDPSKEMTPDRLKDAVAGMKIPLIPEPHEDFPSSKVKPVHIDGALYAAIGALTALLVCLTSDQAKAALSPIHLWAAQTVVETINGGLLALKMFRSTAYADSKQ